MISSRIPMSALLHSITSSFESYYNKHRAVPLAHLNRVCSGVDTARLRLGTMDREEAMHERGDRKLDRMLAELVREGAACVQVEHNPFDRE